MQLEPCATAQNGAMLELGIAMAGHPVFATEVVVVDPLSFPQHPADAAATAAGRGDRGGVASTSSPHDEQRCAADQAAIASAGRMLRAGGVVAMPTETVYGLAANALDADAVARIFAAKGRPSDNPLIVHVSSLDMLATLYPPGWALPKAYAAAVATHWPGPLTILLPRPTAVPLAVTAGLETVAVRLPAHPVARALIDAAGAPLAAPSANRSGRPSPTSAAHVVADLGGRLALVIDGGPCGCGVESTVLDAGRDPPAVLRPGGATVEALAALPGLERLQVYRKDFVDASLEAAPTTPGMKYRHYCPDARVVLLDGGGGGVHDAAQRELRAMAAAGARTVAWLRTTGCDVGSDGDGSGSAAPVQPGSWSTSELPCRTSASGTGAPAVELHECFLGPAASPAVVARTLFSALREADARGADAVLVEGVAEIGEGLAVMNRLRKAAAAVVAVAAGEDVA